MAEVERGRLVTTSGVELPLVRVEAAGGVATITLDSPGNRNALSRRLLAELAASLDTALATPDVRVLVLTGAGTAFCSGADLTEQREAAAAGGRPAPLAALPALLARLEDSPRPVVCRLNGPARAGGIGLLAACDLVVAGSGVSFAFPEVRLGVVPAIIAVPVLRRVPPQAAHRLFLTGEVFGAEAAAGIGLVDEVAADGGLDDAVQRLVDMLLLGAPGALTAARSLARTVPGLARDEAYARMGRLSAELFLSAEGQEGMRAYAEKRPPAWLDRGGS